MWIEPHWCQTPLATFGICGKKTEIIASKSYLTKPRQINTRRYIWKPEIMFPNQCCFFITTHWPPSFGRALRGVTHLTTQESEKARNHTSYRVVRFTRRDLHSARVLWRIRQFECRSRFRRIVISTYGNLNVNISFRHPFFISNCSN